jgi:hypothetical protein
LISQQQSYLIQKIQIQSAHSRFTTILLCTSADTHSQFTLQCVGIYTCVLCLCERRTSVCSGQFLFSFFVDKFCHFFQPKNWEFFGFLFIFGSLNMIISLSCWKDGKILQIFISKQLGQKKHPLVGRGLVNH